MSADKELKAYIDRVLRLKEEQDALGQDIRDVYAEAKAQGYDKTVMGKLVAHLRKVLKEGDTAVSEQEDIFDTYLQAYRRASGMPVGIDPPSRAHTHEEAFDAETGEILDHKLAHTIVSGIQAETGRAALIAAVDIMIAQEEAEEHQASDDSPIVPPSPAESEAEEISAIHFQAKASGEQTGGPSGHLGCQPLTGDASRPSGGGDTPATIPPSDDDAVAAVKGNARLANAAGVEPSSSGQMADQPHAGGDHVTAQPSSAATAGAAVSAAPAKSPLRPHCLNPGENCGGYGTKHCRTCSAAMQEREVA